MRRYQGGLVVALSLAAIALARPGLAQAPNPPPTSQLTPARFRTLEENTITIRASFFRQVAREEDERPFPSAALQAPAFTQGSSTTAIELATAALRTSVDGSEAGVSVAPLALAGDDRSPIQTNVTLAALKDKKTEYGIAVFYQTVWTPQPKDFGLPGACAFDAKKQEELRRNIEALRPSVEDVCNAMAELKRIPDLHPSPAVREAVDICSAAGQCDHPDPDGPPRCMGMIELIRDMNIALRKVPKGADDARKKAEADAKKAEADAKKAEAEANTAGVRTAETETRKVEAVVNKVAADAKKAKAEAAVAAVNRVLSDHKAAIGDLQDFEHHVPIPDCLSPDQIADAVVAKNWSHPRYRVGLGATYDIFPIDFGFNPDPATRLPDGEPSKVTLRAEFARVSGPFEVHLNVGVGRSRSDLDQPMYWFVSPALSIAATVCSLSGDSLYKDGQLNVVNGEPPPRLALGLDGQMEYGLTRPDQQATAFQAISITPHLDFIFTKNLGVRIGVPLTAQLVSRKADPTKTPPVAARTDLQWSIPVYATTVLKL